MGSKNRLNYKLELYILYKFENIIGITAGHPRFGAVPKISLAVIFGYFVGKYSYHKKCTEKFMALPNSKVGEMLRARRGNVTQPKYN